MHQIPNIRIDFDYLNLRLVVAHRVVHVMKKAMSSVGQAFA